MPNALKQIKGSMLKELKAKQDAYEASFLSIPETDPWVPIKLGTKEFKLEYNFAAAQIIQREFGKNIFAGELSMQDLANMDTLVRVLSIGLSTHQPDMTDDQLFPLITLKHRMYYVHCISKALEVTQPDYESMSELIGDLQEMTAELEAGDTSAPLPEIVPYPGSGDNAE